MLSFQANLDQAWIGSWLDAVVDGFQSASRRPMAMIERHGGIEAAIAAAKSRNVHLMEIIDDSGRHLVAASRTPFRALC